MSFEELGIYQLLMEVPDEKRVWEFAASRLKPVLDYDQKNEKNLLQTLEIYLQLNCNAVQTAQRLYVHRNTLTYQIAKIRDLLGLDIEESENRNMLYDCLKIYRYCEH